MAVISTTAFQIFAVYGDDDDDDDDDTTMTSSRSQHVAFGRLFAWYSQSIALSSDSMQSI